MFIVRIFNNSVLYFIIFIHHSVTVADNKERKKRKGTNKQSITSVITP